MMRRLQRYAIELTVAREQDNVRSDQLVVDYDFTDSKKHSSLNTGVISTSNCYGDQTLGPISS